MNSASNNKLPLVMFLGPTAVGKTQVAIQTAKIMGHVEIISCDSRLFYRGMDIGTAKPSEKEMAGIPHLMIDIAEPDEIISLGIFQQMVSKLISEIHARGNLPFLVGGTGQYIRAVTQGWDVPEIKPDVRLRTFLENQKTTSGVIELQRWLRKLDMEAYGTVDIRNPRRLVRALEIILSTGEPLSKHRTKGDSPFHLIQIGLILPRDQLFKRIDQRIMMMIEQGLEQEVRLLLGKGYGAELASMSAIGYGEMAAYIQGRMSLEDAIVLMKRRTHAFVRRQANWFKETDPNIHWFDADRVGPEEIVGYIQSKLAGTLS